MAHINFVHSFSEFLSLPEKTKDMEFFAGKDDNHAWKLHIFLNQDERTVTDPIIKNTAKFFIDNNISFKMGNGGDGGKVFTAYIGEFDKASQVATQLNTLFGEEYKKDCPSPQKTSSDILVFNNIGMRFEGTKYENKDSLFMHYGVIGIPTLDRNLQFNGINDRKLSALACHIFLAEKCGTKYLGSDYKNNPWANKVFADLPNKYNSQQISDYVSQALNILRATHQERFIYEKNLVDSSQGIKLSVDEIISGKNTVKTSPERSRIADAIAAKWQAGAIAAKWQR